MRHTPEGVLQRLRVAKRALEPLRPWTEFPAKQLVDLPWYERPRPHEVALTFDDGPHPEFTPKVLDTLVAHDATATFFLCGLAVQAYPDLVKRIYAEGHTIGGHSWSHRSMLGRPADETAAELDRTHELIHRLTGYEIRLFRPPWGQHDSGLADALRVRSLTAVLWSVDSGDWRSSSPDDITNRVVRQTFPGAIALFHDSKANAFGQGWCDLRDVDRSPTVHALAAILTRYDRQGLAVRSLRTA